MKKNITIVTGLWDMGRGQLDGWAKRDFSYYKEKFFEFLKADTQMCIWISKDLEEEVLKARDGKPTKIFIRNLEDFETWNPFFQKIQDIRSSESWLSQADWLRESPQAALKYYNAMMFTKMFMLNDSAVNNPFNSDYFFWIDGGLTNTVHEGYFSKDMVLDNLDNYTIKHDSKFIHLSYPYEGNTEIHGFERSAMARYCNTDFVRYVCRGGVFGGAKDKVHKLNELYYGVMQRTLTEGYMGADECLFTILTHTNPDIIHKFEIGGDGMVWPFFEELKNYDKKELINDSSFLDPENASLYVITFNSPKQFETLIDSMLKYDPNFINKPKKYLLDNSNDLSTTPAYVELCEKHGFEHIKKDNLGICGGRQWVAEHFDKSDSDYMFFFEDDMFFYSKPGDICKSGFNRYIDNLYNRCMKIIQEEKFDFLKLSFSEFYGNNSTQWSWYNVPQSKREEFWPEYCKLPQYGTDPNSPRTNFKNIKSVDGLAYATGEVYYCNWPQLVSKPGSKKMFMDTTWGHPYEQTWMSHIFQETRAGKINPAILLLSPTEHDRFEHYDGSLRKES
jgi:hypothetical protein